MNIFEQIYTLLNVAAVTSVTDDISPYVRGRKKGFPCVLFEVPNETFDRDSGGTYRIASEVELRCIARSVNEAEVVADAVLSVLTESACLNLESISREYEEGYDDDSVGLFTVTINFTLYSGV